MNILVTGSEGKIGKIIAPKLSAKHTLYLVDIEKTNKRNYFRADLSDFNQLNKLFGKIEKLDCIIHLAADSQVNASWESVLKNNVVATHNIYECARVYNVPKIIFASSTHVTGAYEGNPRKLHLVKKPKKISVNDPIRPDSDYGTSKAFGEALARQYWELYKIHSICLRIGNVNIYDEPRYPRDQKIWLSYRDLIQVIEKSLVAKIDFGIYYAISNNTGAYWDISNSTSDLGYKPLDNAVKQKRGKIN